MKTFFTLIMLLLLIVTVAPACHAQFDFMGGGEDTAPPAPPWTQFQLNPNVHIKLDFRNASIDAVIQTLSQASGIPIVKDPALVGGITLQSPKPQSLNDAFAMFNAVLGLKNAVLSKQGNFLLIKVQAQGGGRFSAIGSNAGAMAAFGNSRATSQTPVLQVYVLKYSNATNLATTINNVFATTQSGTPANPIAAAIQAFTGGGGAPGGGGGGFGGGGAGGGGGRGRGLGSLLNGVTGDTVKASADDFSNSLIVNAPQRDQDEIAAIIDQIDRPATQPQSSEVFRLTYALASDMLPVVQNMLANTTTLGRGTSNSSTQNRNTGGGGGPFGGFFNRGNTGSNNNANGSVSADTRTNSLVVTTTDVLMTQIAQVIQNLDKPATYQASTFIYVMQNARADVVANLLNESFGNRETNGPIGGALTTTGATQPTITSSSLSSGSTGSSSPMGSLSSSSTNRSSSSNNQSVTSSNSTLETQGLDEDSRIVNIRNLTGNVLLVPNEDTNSIIVVSPPEDWPIVKGILQQMDQIPQQVMIDTLIVEVSLDKTDQFGIEYSGPANHGIFSQIFGLQSTYASNTGSAPYTTANGAALPAPGADEGLVYTLSAGQYSAFVQAAATDSKIDVLSTPRIFTSNNATAQINVSQSVPYETGSAVSNGTTQNSFDFLDVGLVLTVTPRITSSGYVTMDVSQTANSIAAFLDNNTEPEVNQREAETTVSVMDGRTVCLGGIIQDTINSTVDKVPLLGDIPLIGDLFKNTTKSDDKDELLVFLTPHVINNPENAETVRASNAANLDGDAAAMLKKANITPKTGEASSTTNVLPTIVTVTPNIQTTPPVIVGPTGGSVYAAPPGPTVNPPVAPGMTTPVTPATTKTQVAPSAVTTTTTQVTSPTPTPPATSAAPVVTTSPLGIDSTGNVTTN